MSAIPQGATESHVTLPIRDLGCPAAAPGVERLLRKIPGVVQVYVNPLTEMAYVGFDPGRCTEARIRAALVQADLSIEAGHSVSPTGNVRHRRAGRLSRMAAGVAQMFGAARHTRSGDEAVHTQEEKTMQTKDPVCGMNLEEADAVATESWDGKRYFFCSHRCHASFKENPATFARKE